MTTRPHMTVVVSGNRIKEVGPDAKVKAPAGAEVIDAGGRTLMPGLWDMHVHLFGGDGLMHMAAGVTSVRDMGNDTEQLLALRRKFDEGTSIGPRVPCRPGLGHAQARPLHGVRRARRGIRPRFRARQILRPAFKGSEDSHRPDGEHLRGDVDGPARSSLARFCSRGRPPAGPDTT